jgi:adenosylcobyric acid synthase
LIKGIVINKFRGQRSLLESGIAWLEDYTGIRVIGVLPYVESLFPAEDSLDLWDRRSGKPSREITVAVIRLQRISNFTDFDPLDAEPSVSVKYVLPHQRLGNPDVVILPGTKTTVADLKLLHESGMAQQLQDYQHQGGTIFGICGGLQMLGREVADPDGIEGEAGDYPGLDLLPIQTVMTQKKVTRQRTVESIYPITKTPVIGYEIHQGRTDFLEAETTKALFTDPHLGLVNESQSVWGCYLHGIFDNGEWRRTWLNQLRQKKGLAPLPTNVDHYSQQRDRTFETLADFVEEYLDLTPIMS